ncbi:hypothetical protein JGH11_16045 [Dysgonomonas sp. Marseille-P4677]|uniref:hypothetical protein n=1 Tax=Dysgonomonas sp. Marseille-P4677 TaxID=2364790 RepID=UPI0019120BE9|nr:hypothetical protein [Dysgonomonas sp. Marseille-P4677]MBK5722388.1 hypothetical protein [Dysgonomonas sp. Marseille-P4677]
MKPNAITEELAKAIDAMQSGVEKLIDRYPENREELVNISNNMGVVDMLVNDALEQNKRLALTSGFMQTMWTLTDIEEMLDDMYMTWIGTISDNTRIGDGHSLIKEATILFRLVLGK